MKKVYLLSAACAALGLASCSSDEYTGLVPNEEVEQPELITFASSNNANSRATAEGAAAAKLLNNKFWIYGTKSAPTKNALSASTLNVFDNYELNWNTTTQGKAETNPKGWEYAGYTSRKGAEQDAKYWDLDAGRYDFVAVTGLADGENINNTRDGFSVNIIPDDPATKGVDESNWTSIYFADRVTATKDGAAATATTPQMAKYKDVVTFNFRRLAAKMRVGFYETIPGYAVRNLKFYYRTAQYGSPIAGLGGAFPHDGVYSISYDNKTNAAKAAFQPGGTTYAYNDFGELQYTIAKSKAGVAGAPYLGPNGGSVSLAKAQQDGKVFLGTEANDPTWAVGKWTIDHEAEQVSMWKPILPNEANTTGMQLIVSFELVSVDGTKETIYVNKAHCTIPAEYCQWKPNYAYTYLFKISDATNGTTNPNDPYNPDPDQPDNPDPTDPEDPDPTHPFTPDFPDDPDAGLYPITFDAIVMDETEIQETITTVSEPAITTYAPASDVTADNEYKKDTKISLIISNVTPDAVDVTSTPYATQITELEAATADKNGYITWTAAAGNATKGYSFTPSAAGYYVVRLTYTYTDPGTSATETRKAYKVVKVIAPTVVP